MNVDLTTDVWPYAAALRDLRAQAGRLSVERAAARIGISRATWHAWESGKQRPTHDSLRAIVEAFGADEVYRFTVVDAVLAVAARHEAADESLEWAHAGPLLAWLDTCRELRNTENVNTLHKSMPRALHVGGTHGRGSTRLAARRHTARAPR